MAQLRRSNDRMITGTAAGIAEYFGIDKTLVRVLFAICVVLGGTGLLIYLVAFIIMALSEKN